MKISRRYKKGPLRTRVVRKIEDVSPEEWGRVFPDVLEGYYFFKTLDESGFDQFAFYYILVYERKRLVGAASCFLLDYSLDTSVSGPLRCLSNAIRKVLPNLFCIKSLACGIPMGSGQMGSAGDPPAVLGAILRRMEQIARKTRAHVLAFKDFNRSYASLLDPLLKEGFLKVDGLPTTELPLGFSDFDEYLKTLSGAARYDLRRKFKRIAAVKIESTVVDALDDKTLEEAYRLYLQMVEKHEMGFELVPIGFFKRISQNMPREAKYFLWRVDGKLVAFLFCLVSDTLLMDYYVGLDYAVARQYHLYFVKFRDVMNWCMVRGIKKYDMGYTSYGPKRRLGFDLVPLYLYVKLRYRLLRPLFKLLPVFFKFENFDPELKRWHKERGA